MRDNRRGVKADAEKADEARRTGRAWPGFQKAGHSRDHPLKWRKTWRFAGRGGAVASEKGTKRLERCAF